MPFLSKYNTTWFVAGELLRFLCVFALLIVPTVLLGLTFPLLLNLYSDSPRDAGTKVGRVYAANTVGTVLGSVITGFVVLPHLGSSGVLRACATMNMLLGLGFALALLRIGPAGKRALAFGGAAVVGLLLAVHYSWDMQRVTGTYAYFGGGWVGEKVLFLKEDVQGGLTSVVQAGSLRTLLSNGKFQGDNGEGVQSQTRFALLPALFTRHFERALVIGLGIGGTLHTVGRFPFRRIDAVEIAPQLVEAARRWFSDLNEDIFDRDPRVTLTVADGRNFLLLSRQQYDLITIEITSLWISGESDLYNKEFYELCRSHLNNEGVLQQWVALHHLRTQDLLVLLNTAARVFPHVAFFCEPGQSHGLLIASSSPLECDYRQIAGFDQDPGVRQELKTIGAPSAWSLLGEVVLYDSSFRQAIALLPKLTGLRADFASTDFRPYLEYQAPKGITVPYDTTRPNLEFLEKFRVHGLPSELLIRQLPPGDEKNLILGYVAEAQRNVEEAAEYFSRVHGPGSEQAHDGIVRLSVMRVQGRN
jgi:spermidine synthase